MLCERPIADHDLLIPSWALGPRDWRFAYELNPSPVGSMTNTLGHLVLAYSGSMVTYRVYRICAVPSRCDDKVDEAPERVPHHGVSASVAEAMDQLSQLTSEVRTQLREQSKARTDDSGKAPLAYLPWDGIREVAQVQSYGHKKYGDFYNYRKGMEVGRNLSCAIRHIADYMDGNDVDHESGRSHLAHAACRLLFVLQNIHDGTIIDDRFSARVKTNEAGVDRGS